MQKTTATAGGTGVVAASAALYNQSWDFWMDALPVVTMCGIAGICILTLCVFALWRRVKALEAKQ